MVSYYMIKERKNNTFHEFASEAGVKNPNPRKRKKQALKIGHGGTLDSAASGVLGEFLLETRINMKDETQAT